MSRRHRTAARRRLLSMEALEERRLLVAGTVPPDDPPPAALPQNPANPEDTNYDGEISPGDALIVINRLNRGHESGSPNSFSTDVDGDGIVTPRDALLVINRLNSRSEKSSVPPQQRAIGLRRALDAGVVPPKMSRSDAEELLETLEKGGHYEAGDRYHSGRMFNIRQQPQDLGGASAGVELENAATSAEQTVDATSENLSPETTSPHSVEENDPLALFDSADETLSDPLYDLTLWHAFVDATDPSGTESDDRFSIGLAEQRTERLASEDARDRFAQVIADAVQSGDKNVEDIIDEVAALRATAGDVYSEIARLFGNLDVEGIIEQISVDLGTLAEAIVSSDDSDSPHDEAYWAEFLRREYLNGLDEILP